MFCRSRNSCILLIFWYFADFSFPALRVFSFCRFTMKLKVWIFKNSQFCKISAFGEFRKTRRSKQMEESSKTQKLRSVKIMCLRGGVCLFLIVMQISLSFSLACSLLCCPSLCRALLFYPSLCHPLLSSCCCRSLCRSGGARPDTAEENRDALLPPLPLTKKTLL